MHSRCVKSLRSLNQNWLENYKFGGLFLKTHDLSHNSGLGLHQPRMWSSEQLKIGNSPRVCPNRDGIARPVSGQKTDS